MKRSGTGDVRQRASVLVFVGFAVWAAALSVRGYPVLGPISAVVLLEVSLATWRALAMAGKVIVDAPLTARIDPLLAELCGRAECVPPLVALRDGILRPALVRHTRYGPVLVMSAPYGHSLDDAELSAVLAHEVAHLAHGDLAIARRRVGVVGVASLASFCLTMFTAGGVSAEPIGVAAALVCSLGTTALLSFRNRPLEWRADREGSRLCADPRAMRSALSKADVEIRAARAELFRPPWRWLLWPVSWRMPTHPPMHARLAQLDQLDAQVSA